MDSHLRLGIREYVNQTKLTRVIYRIPASTAKSRKFLILQSQVARKNWMFLQLWCKVSGVCLKCEWRVSCPKIFFGTKHFCTQIVLDPSFSWQKFFWAKDFFGAIFFTLNLYWPQNIWPKFLVSKIVLDPIWETILDQKLFYTKILALPAQLVQNFIVQLGLKLQCSVQVLAQSRTPNTFLRF